MKEELADVPVHVKEFFDKLPNSQIESVSSTEETNELAKRYIAEGVITQLHANDCKHIALATICKVDFLVSWNCKHMVNGQKIRGYNGVNMLLGYQTIDIRTPYEVIYEADENEN